ncbi:MAG: glycosyl transferase, group 1 [Microbacteriaceae bacterium]|nr:glycosyl transferase, group 1 [Microbacteriaceae bacterium]
MSVDPDGQRPRPVVLHVSEGVASGVAAAIKDYVRNTPEFEHHLLFSERADSPAAGSDLAGFAGVHRMPHGHLKRARSIGRVASELGASIVHAHSSRAGVYVRLGLRSSAKRPIVYSPHCYAFERRDLSAVARLCIRLTEWALSRNTAVFAVCSRRELQLSRWPASRARAIYVPNVATVTPVLPRYRPGAGAARLVVAGAGRIGPQKDPHYFIAAIRALRESGVDVEARWIGGGDASVEAELTAAGVQVTGWLTRSAGLEALSKADLYLHTAAWEGFPIAVLEAEALEVATVVRRIPAFDDEGLPAMISRPEEFADRWPEFADEDARVALVGLSRHALADHTDQSQRTALLDAWNSVSRHSTSS